MSKMSKINVSQWKEFKLTKLFEPHHGKRLTKRNRVSGDVPFLTAGFDSQGVKGYLAGNFEIWHNPISIDMFGNCFYHECDCAGDDNVYALVNNDMTSNVKLFIAGILNKQLSIQFSYKDQFRQHDLDVLSIKLPTDSAGNPDWHYMDEYIAKLATQAHTNISLLRQQQKKAPTVNIDRWKEFKLTELFNVKTGAYLSKNQLKPGSIPRVTVSSVNNGIVGSFERCGLSNERLFSNFLSVNFFGNVFYHDSLCSVDMKVHVLEPKHLYSKESMLFLVAVLRRKFVIEGYGTYGNQLSSSKLKMDMVYLPVDASGSPDWQYMDNYISSIQQAQKERVARLTSIIK